MSLKEEALEYHRLNGRGGKISSIPTKPTKSQKDLSLAYSPGVAEPCIQIGQDESLAYEYTNKGNLVAVISNGTAILGLGDLGAQASKPVMEGKSLLLKLFAGIDSFDLEIKSRDVEEIITVVKNLEPSFGGINLEDFKAPECFEIERRLKELMNIPVMHDDQHGTAMITGAAFLNASEIVGIKKEDMQIVINGAGASAISCARLMVKLGAKLENITMLDSKGVISKDRTDLNEYKKEFASSRKEKTLQEAIKGANLFLGLSKGDVLSADMLKSMAKNPIVFACANPTPEINYDLAISTRSDVIIGTGRSDHPNQINNVLGFPFIFRGALDIRAKEINDEMKLAVSRALANLAKQPVEKEVLDIYGLKELSFGPQYVVPKPFDRRIILEVAPAVAKAGMQSGVARKEIKDFDEYKKFLQDIVARDKPLYQK